MKKLVIFSVLNGLIGAFLFILMGDYVVSENKLKKLLKQKFTR